MQPLKLLSTVSGLWWKKYDKITLIYPLLFLLMYFTASADWLTAKPIEAALDIIRKFTSVDFSQSYNGMKLMGWYFWLLLLPFVFSLALFNRISVCLLHVFVIIVLLLKIYDTYVDLESGIPFKQYLAPYIYVDKHFELYLFFVLLSASFLFSIIHVFLSKKSVKLP
jgi:hypothetical protein